MFSTIFLSSILSFGTVGDESTYVQPTTSLKDTKADLAAHGSEYSKVQLIYTDNSLLEDVKKYCPNMTSFEIENKYLLLDLTDKGLKTIGSFPPLSELAFTDESASISIAGIHD